METRLKKIKKVDNKIKEALEVTSFYSYLNHWADLEKHPEATKDGKKTDYGKGYEDACKDILGKVYDNKVIVETNIFNVKIMEDKNNGKQSK